MSRVTHWIDGKPWRGATERSGEVCDPATGQVDFATEAEEALGILTESIAVVDEELTR